MAGSYTKFSNDYRRVVLHGDPDYTERQAAGVIKPGSLVAIDADGKVAVNANADAQSPNLLFACEDVIQGNTINDDYAVDQIARCAVFGSGDEVLAIAVDDSIEVGNKVASNGDGTLKLQADPAKAIGQVLHKYTDPDDAAVIRIVIQIFG